MLTKQESLLKLRMAEKVCGGVLTQVYVSLEEVEELIDDIYFEPCHWPKGADEEWTKIPPQKRLRWINNIEFDFNGDVRCVFSQLLAKHLYPKEAL